MPARNRAHPAPKRKLHGRGASSRPPDVAVQIAAPGAAWPSPAKLRRWARGAIARSARVTIRVAGEREARRLNRTYRDEDHATNVLSFPYDCRPGAVCGDIVLCAPVIRREALQQGKELDAHFAHLVVHGLLHLQGYDHDRPRSANRMEALETEILAKLGYPDPYRG